MSRYYHYVSHDELLRATRALLKFCRDRNYPEGGLTDVQACEAALADDDFHSAVSLIHAPHLVFRLARYSSSERY